MELWITAFFLCALFSLRTFFFSARRGPPQRKKNALNTGPRCAKAQLRQSPFIEAAARLRNTGPRCAKAQLRQSWLISPRRPPNRRTPAHAVQKPNPDNPYSLRTRATKATPTPLHSSTGKAGELPQRITMKTIVSPVTKTTPRAQAKPLLYSRPGKTTMPCESSVEEI